MEGPHEGKLILIVGPMYSGKTTELISYAEIYVLGKKYIKVFKSILDDRYDKTYIVSHSNARIQAIPIKTPADILKNLRGDEKAVFIDEVQFLDLSLISVILSLTHRGMQVYCAGLDLNFKNRPFETTMHLMAHADQVIKKRAVCHQCGEYEATISHKRIEDDREIDVGGFEKYIATCRRCYRSLNASGHPERITDFIINQVQQC